MPTGPAPYRANGTSTRRPLLVRTTDPARLYAIDGARLHLDHCGQGNRANLRGVNQPPRPPSSTSVMKYGAPENPSADIAILSLNFLVAHDSQRSHGDSQRQRQNGCDRRH